MFRRANRYELERRDMGKTQRSNETEVCWVKRLCRYRGRFIRYQIREGFWLLPVTVNEHSKMTLNGLFNGWWFTVNDISVFIIWCLSYFDIKENAIDQMDPAQIKKFAQDLQKQTDTVIFCIEHHHDYFIIIKEFITP